MQSLENPQRFSAMNFFFASNNYLSIIEWPTVVGSSPLETIAGFVLGWASERYPVSSNDRAGCASSYLTWPFNIEIASNRSRITASISTDCCIP